MDGWQTGEVNSKSIEGERQTCNCNMLPPARISEGERTREQTESNFSCDISRNIPWRQDSQVIESCLSYSVSAWWVTFDLSEIEWLWVDEPRLVTHCLKDRGCKQTLDVSPFWDVWKKSMAERFVRQGKEEWRSVRQNSAAAASLSWYAFYCSKKPPVMTEQRSIICRRDCSFSLGYRLKLCTVTVGNNDTIGNSEKYHCEQ